MKENDISNTIADDFNETSEVQPSSVDYLLHI